MNYTIKEAVLLIFTRTSKIFSRNENAATFGAKDLSADSAVVLPPKGGESGRTFVALDRNGVRHPILTRNCSFSFKKIVTF